MPGRAETISIIVQEIDCDWKITEFGKPVTKPPVSGSDVENAQSRRRAFRDVRQNTTQHVKQRSCSDPPDPIMFAGQILEWQCKIVVWYWRTPSFFRPDILVITSKVFKATLALGSQRADDSFDL